MPGIVGSPKLQENILPEGAIFVISEIYVLVVSYTTRSFRWNCFLLLTGQEALLPGRCEYGLSDGEK